MVRNHYPSGAPKVMKWIHGHGIWLAKSLLIILSHLQLVTIAVLTWLYLKLDMSSEAPLVKFQIFIFHSLEQDDLHEFPKVTEQNLESPDPLLSGLSSCGHAPQNKTVSKLVSSLRGSKRLGLREIIIHLTFWPHVVAILMLWMKKIVPTKHVKATSYYSAHLLYRACLLVYMYMCGFHGSNKISLLLSLEGL